MSSLDKEILKLVRKIRDRIHTGRIIDHMLMGTVAALVIGFVLAILARFIPIYGVYTRILVLTAAVAGGALIISTFLTPDNVSSALKADSLGLNERVVTALELIGVDSVFARLEKNDTLDKLKKIDFKKKLPITPNKKYIALAFILAIAITTTGFIPNPMAEKAEELHRIKEKVEAKQKKVEELSKSVKEDIRLTQEQKKELEQTLKEIKKDLAGVKDEKTLEKALFKAEKKLEAALDKYADTKENADKVKAGLEMDKSLKDMAAAFKERDESKMRQSLKNLAKSMKDLSEEQRKALSNSFMEMAKELRNNDTLKDALYNAAQDIAKGELGDLSEEFEELADALTELMKDEEFRRALEQLGSEIDSVMNRGNLGNNSSGQEDDGHQGNGKGNTQGNKPGSGQGSPGSGQGNQGSKGKGPGAGSGTDMGQEDPTPLDMGSSGISKKDASVKKSGEYEKIFTSKTLGGDGEKSELSGQKGSGGRSDQIITDKPKTIRGESVPYNQVIGEYKQSAFQSMNSSSIPEGMKDLVKDYFSSLDE